MHRIKHIAALVALCALLLLAFPAASQDSALIVEGNLRGETGIGSLNPLRCDNVNCARITDLLFPYLLHVDPASRTFAPATADSGGLVVSWEFDGDSVTYRVRDDLIWSDGAPITAYDVYFSYLVAASDEAGSSYRDFIDDVIVSAEVLNTNTIRFNYAESTCAALDFTNIPVLPAHVFQPDFAAIASTPAALELDFSDLWRHPADDQPAVTVGDFTFYERRYAEYVRLLSPDESLAYAYVDVPDSNTAVDRFLRGELNLLVNPPYNRRHDLRAANMPEFQQPGNQWYFIALNQADPFEPRSAVDREGQPLEQGNHPILGDARVRRALQMALDVPALIETALEGDGVAIPSAQPPASWAYNPALNPIPYDPVGAAALLREAGWRDINRDGVLECFDCLYARKGRLLEFELIYFEGGSDSAQPTVNLSVVANLVSQQLARVGVSVYTAPFVQGDSFGVDRILNQQFDAALLSFEEYVPVDADQTYLFATDEDVLGSGLNFVSYHRPEVDDLLRQARTDPTCAVEQRRAAYGQIQAILQDDQPYLWLFSPIRATFAHDDGLRFPGLTGQ